MGAERQSRSVTLLLTVIAVAAVVIAAVLVVPLFSGGESAAHRAARQDAEQSAGYYCSLGSTATSLDDPAYRSCVKRRVRETMAAWENAH